MAFTSNTFIRLSAQANSDAAAVFVYRSGSDDVATISAANYFDPASQVTGGLGLKNQDCILIQGTDGTTILEMAVDGAGAATVTRTNAFA